MTTADVEQLREDQHGEAAVRALSRSMMAGTATSAMNSIWTCLRPVMRRVGTARYGSSSALPSPDPGTWTLLVDGEPTTADVTSTGTSVMISGRDTPSSVPETIGGDSPVEVNAVGDHTVQIAGVLVDGRSIAFNLGIEVAAAVGFDDVDPDSAHGAAILRLAELEIVGGYADGTYRPVKLIDRGQMAAFLQRALRLHPGAPGAFDDVVGTTHELSIGAVAEAGIAGGFGDGTYRPRSQVTRSQMAIFLANATGLAEVADGPFTDIDGNPHAGTINAVAAADIASGFPDGTYQPSVALTRAQMASPISRMLDHLQAAG